MNPLLSKIIPSVFVKWLQNRRLINYIPGTTATVLDNLSNAVVSSIGKEYRHEMNALAQNYPEDPFLSKGAIKYTYIDDWIRVNVARAIKLGLHQSSGKRILDLGCGTGQFLAVCRYFGHDVWGVDLPFESLSREECDVYKASCRLLHLEERIFRVGITRSMDMSDLATVGKFDFITAFMVRFYAKADQYWTCDDWYKFLQAILPQVTESGFCHFEFNAEPEDFPVTLYHDVDVTRYLNSIGDFSKNVLKIHKQPASIDQLNA